METAIDQVSTWALVDTNEVRTGGRRGRRRWPDDLKRRMVLESGEPGASVSVVARRYDVNANQLFKWRRQYETLSVGSPLSPEPARLVPVEVQGALSSPMVGGTIEIELMGGTRIRAIGQVDGGLLERVLKVLR